ncbi:MAG TPA: TonB-dependent receptor, partial [bacterium]|nr:TonB-dependent receptor [bacterium]
MTNNVFSFFFAWQNLLLLVLCVPNAFAQTGPSVEVDRIVIVESLQSDPLPSGSIKPSADISLKATIPKTESAADVVSQVAGVHIKRFGGLEDATSISIRGSTNAEVNVFLDGVPLDTASADGVGLGQIAATSLSRIEIFKSTSPSELGGSAIGGVINLSSKKAEPGLNQRYGFGFGSFMTYDGLAELSYGGVKNDVVFGFDARRTDGDFMYQDNNGTPLNPADDQEVRRQNSEKQALHPHLNWKHYFNERNEMTLAQHFFRIDAGVSGLGAFQSQTADKSLTEYLGSVAMKSRGHFGDKSALTHKTYYRLIKSQFSDPNAEIGLGRAQDNDNLTVVIGNRHMWQTDFSKKVAVKKGAEHVYERFAPRDFLAADPVGSTSARHQLNFFVEPHLYLFERKVHLSSQGQSLNVFYDINNDDPSLNDSGTFFSNKIENQFAGQMALIYSPFSAWHVKVSAGREVRLPKFVELFGDQGFVLGNPQLSSEKSFKYDIGFEGAKSFAGFVNKITVGVALFENRI